MTKNSISLLLLGCVVALMALPLCSACSDDDPVKEAEALMPVDDFNENGNSNGLLGEPWNRFLYQWWECSTVKINGIDEPQATTWTVEGGLYIPPTVRDSYRPDQGWEMAFSYLNTASLDGVRYLALYNKYSGVLRVYTYLLNPGIPVGHLALSCRRHRQERPLQAA